MSYFIRSESCYWIPAHYPWSTESWDSTRTSSDNQLRVHPAQSSSRRVILVSVNFDSSKVILTMMVVRLRFEVLWLPQVMLEFLILMQISNCDHVQTPQYFLSETENIYYDWGNVSCLKIKSSGKKTFKPLIWYRVSIRPWKRAEFHKPRSCDRDLPFSLWPQ